MGMKEGHYPLEEATRAGRLEGVDLITSYISPLLNFLKWNKKVSSLE